MNFALLLLILPVKDDGEKQKNQFMPWMPQVIISRRKIELYPIYEACMGKPVNFSYFKASCL